MKLISYQNDRGPRIAALRGNEIIDLHDADPALPSCPKALLAQGPEAIGRAEKALAAGRPVTAPVTWLPPIPSPEKIICIGLNYADHARETKAAVPSCPVVFNKFPTALLPHEGTVRLPRASEQVDYEAELVLVIGRGGRHIPQDEARSHIAAYTCGNDVSARDWQRNKPGGQWLSGKSFDTFAPCGPWMVTADEIPEPGKLAIKLRLNGQVMQDSNTAELIFPVEHARELHLAVLHLESRRLDFHRHARRRRHGAAAARLLEARRRDRGRDRADRRVAEPVRGGVDSLTSRHRAGSADIII